MFVVNTTSATVVLAAPRSVPRNRVPSSRRRNPGVSGRSGTGYGLRGAGAGGVVPEGGVVVTGVAPEGALVGGGVRFTPGTALFVPPEGDGGDVAGGAGATGCASWSSTDFGARCRVEASDSTNEMNRKMPPPHQLALVRRLPACPGPTSASDKLLP